MAKTVVYQDAESNLEFRWDGSNLVTVHKIDTGEQVAKINANNPRVGAVVSVQSLKIIADRWLGGKRTN